MILDTITTLCTGAGILTKTLYEGFYELLRALVIALSKFTWYAALLPLSLSWQLGKAHRENGKINWWIDVFSDERGREHISVLFGIGILMWGVAFLSCLIHFSENFISK